MGPVLIREGFSWGAFLFGPLWLLAHRLWLAAAVWLVLVAVVALFVSPRVALCAGLGLQFLLASEARDLHRRALARRGWQEEGMVAAHDRTRATQRLLDAPKGAAA